MTKVEVFVYGRQQRRQRRGYDNSSLDFRHGELTIAFCYFYHIVKKLLNNVYMKINQRTILYGYL